MSFRRVLHRSWVRLTLAAAVAAVPMFSAHPSQAVTPTVIVTPQQVDATIEKVRKYIYGQMNGANWETAGSRDVKAAGNALTGGQYGGQTALATYALLASGESPQEPRIVKAIEFLRTADMIGTYALGLRSQVWLNIPKNDQIKAAIEKDAKLLLASRKTTGPNKGMWHYVADKSAITDHSCSQYGVLGLWADSDVLEAIPDAVWADADASWRAHQGADGSWTYIEKPGNLDSKGNVTVGTPSMTAAGIATLFITQDFLYRGRGLTCQGNIVDKNLDKGLAWFSDYYKAHGSGGLTGYSFYGVERIGVASGYKYFGDTDWFQNGAAALVKAQKADGSYLTGGTCTGFQNSCLALLFLSRGRAPVMMNKLNYDLDGKNANWDQRPRDAANLVRWVGKETENSLNWQITTMGSSPEEWHDSPILYITGDQKLNFTKDEKDKLRRFIEEGGLVVGNADCGSREFSDSFRKLGSDIFKEYEFKQLSKSSTILHDEQYDSAKWKHPVPVFALDNGSRVMMLLVPDADPSKVWQMQQTAGHEELYQLATNIYLYAVDKDGMTAKGDTYLIKPNPKIKATKTIDVQRITYTGYDDPEPGGWRQLSAKMHNEDSIDVTATPTEPAKLTGKGVAHLTGTDIFKLDSGQVAAIKAFVDGGGTLVVDACGGSTTFVESADKVLKAIFGSDADQLKTPLPDDHALYTTGGPLGEVTYRTYARVMLGSLHGPRLRGITQNGRLVCIYSREDLSTGLVGEPVDGIIGYSPATAANLMRKILLYATNTKPTPTGATADKPVSMKKPATAPAKK